MHQSMDLPKLLCCSLFLVQAHIVLLLLLVISPQMAAAGDNLLYREYIGAMHKGVKFDDVPINPGVDFHFILAFAVDYTESETTTEEKKFVPTNGKFKVFWDGKNLAPQNVSDIKKKHKNVKVVLSIGGDTVGKTNVLFNATSIESWVENAESSLSVIIKDYHLDGIDINYESFDESVASREWFTECIGQLVRNLKSKFYKEKEGKIFITSIAPFNDTGDDRIQRYYMTLWERYSRYINYVNFQFYGYDAKTTTVEKFLFSDEIIAQRLLANPHECLLPK